MRIIKVFIISIIIATFSSMLYAQSVYLKDGVSGSGFQVNGIITDSSLSTIGLSAAYSIGGMMDFGVSVITEEGVIDDYESRDYNFNLLYNLILMKQGAAQPINIQLEGSYGYVNTFSEYLDSYNRRRTAQGFGLGVFIYHNFFSNSLISINIGGKFNYANFLTKTMNYTDPNVPEIVSEIRTDEIKFGGAAALLIQPDLFPICSIGLSVLYSITEKNFEYSPTISIINPQF